MKILLVEDDIKIANSIKKGLSAQGYVVEVANDADEGIWQILNNDYDLFILDRMLPGKSDGLGILQQARQNNISTPALMLTAKGRILDKAEGLNAGADDYLAKPFAFVELIARVRALLRRPQATSQETIVYKDLTLNADTKTASRGGVELYLTHKEFMLLEYFMRNQGKILSKQKIIQDVWGSDSDILPNNIEVYIGYLRTKLNRPTPAKLINTKRGFGYYFGENKGV